MRLRIGIDLGGTKIEGIALDREREVARIRVNTPRDYAGTIEAIAVLVQALEERAGGSGSVGVGIPGAEAPATGLVKNANSIWLIGRPLRGDLEVRLGREVRLANDANCFAVSEAADGAAAGAEVVFGVIVGTGTGAGIVVRGKVLTGPNGIAGEWGHNPLPWPRDDERPGRKCYCGQYGCIETFLCGPGMQTDHQERSGRHRTPAEIVNDAAEGDRAAQETLDRHHERMARALASVINVLDPDVIVLGGGLSNIRSLYEQVPRLWEPFVFSDASRTRLVQARHGDSSGVRGAAWLWP
ncbi:MAG: ROK family protein [Acidobacteria bacterium]|nr:ROK family protein [Acidobacteriota bacterium]